MSLGNIRAPSLPVSGALAVGLETLFLFAKVFLILNEDHGDYVGWWGVGGELSTGNECRVLQGATGGVGVGVDSQGIDKQCSNQTAKNDSVRRKCMRRCADGVVRGV